jgi:hypothetical protein
VVDREDLGPACFLENEVAHTLVGGQCSAAFAADVDERVQIAAVVAPGVVAVVVGDQPRWIERVDQREVQLSSVCLTRGGRPLARAIEEVPDDLVGDQ